MLYFTFSKGALKEMIYTERDFYSVSKPIFSYYCLKKRGGGGRVGDGWGRVGGAHPLPLLASFNAAMQ